MTSSQGQTRVTHILTLIRHPETVANVAHLLQGSTNSPLSVHGQNQQNALVKAISVSHIKKDDDVQLERKSETPLLAGIHPTHIMTSPLPRALDLASAIKKACENGSDRRISLESRVGLEEKSFGKRENTRAGEHVFGFPVGVKPFEESTAWNDRVKREGMAVLEAATRQTGMRNHVVVVTHGLWLSAFLKIFLAESIRPPFADNTGVYTLAIHDDHKYPAKLSRILSLNDTSHLAGLKRQRGGIGSSASDKNQRTLGDMWTKRKKVN
ncbi:hypothetical protein CBS101457_004443 [Exobasidium rhododendri]|nr:hypothetical protein CBS101457_004443 [Exobasidium rhododendri]